MNRAVLDLGVHPQNHPPTRKDPQVAVASRDDDRRGSGTKRGGCCRHMPSPQPDGQLHVRLGGRQEHPGCLDEAIAADDEGTVEFGQLDQSVVDVEVRERPVGGIVPLEWIGDELPGALEHLHGIAKHEDGADPLPTLGRPADLAGNSDGALEDVWPNPVREFQEIRDDHFFEGRFCFGHNDQDRLAGVDVRTHSTDDELADRNAVRFQRDREDVASLSVLVYRVKRQKQCRQPGCSQGIVCLDRRRGGNSPALARGAL